LNPDSLSAASDVIVLEMRFSFGRSDFMSLYNWVRASYAVGLRHPVDLLVYQMGKVGSPTVQSSLTAAGLEPMQVHYMFADLPRMERFTDTDHEFPFHFYIGRLLRYYFDVTSHRFKVITLVRDPIARHISAQFQTLKHEPIPLDDSEAAAQELRRTIPGISSSPFSWFEREMELFLGTSPLSAPFDKQAGYGILETERVDILALKLEQLTKLISEVVSSFVGENLSVVKANQGREKAYADYYQEVLDRFSLSEKTCREIYGHEHVTHFYSASEIEQFVQKWTS